MKKPNLDTVRRHLSQSAPVDLTRAPDNPRELADLLGVLEAAAKGSDPPPYLVGTVARIYARLLSLAAPAADIPAPHPAALHAAESVAQDAERVVRRVLDGTDTDVDALLRSVNAAARKDLTTARADLAAGRELAESQEHLAHAQATADVSTPDDLANQLSETNRLLHQLIETMDGERRRRTLTASDMLTLALLIVAIATLALMAVSWQFPVAPTIGSTKHSDPHSSMTHASSTVTRPSPNHPHSLLPMPPSQASEGKTG